MLDRQEQRFAVRRELQPADLGLARRTHELAHLAALRTGGRQHEATVVVAARLLAVGDDPQVAARIDLEVVRAGERHRAIAGEHEHVPAETQRGGVAVLFVELEDVAVHVVRARIRRVDARVHLATVELAPFGSRGAFRVLGEGDVDSTAARVDGDVLGPIHGRRAE